MSQDIINKNEIINKLSKKLKSANNSKQKIKKNNQSLLDELIAERKKNFLLNEKINEINEQLNKCEEIIELKNQSILNKEKDILQLTTTLNKELKNNLEFEWISVEK